ncbi:MAG TPA: hypothetical protein VGS20_03890 [Candidatus Acidoferrales bacterium]|nr:hypothetical protein [Candidatus Acidoferrales bacterium]
MRSVGPAVGGVVLAAMMAALAGCSQYIQYPVPAISAISPASAVAGGATFTLTVAGKNFVFGTSVQWNGIPLATFFINGGELQATIDQSLLSTPGTVPVVVVNPSPGGGNSNTFNFTIKPSPTNIPTITSIQPTGTQVGGSGFTLTVNGTKFATTSVVTWNGENLTTTFVNSGQIQGSVQPTDIQLSGIINVAVLNPVPGGGLSNAVQFSVNNPQPTISSISPTQATANGPAFALTVNGRGFVCQVLSTNTTTGVQTCTQSNSVVNWNGSPRGTTWNSSSQLVATITQADLGAAGTSFVTVTNPSPGGGTSAPALYQVIPGPNGEGLPSLVDVSSSGAQASAGIGNPGKSGPVIGGGRFIAFSSISQNLVANLANAVANVFVRDTCLGISQGCTPQTVLGSVGNNAQPPNGDCLEPSISSDGRFVVYTSASTNLVTGAGTGANEIYLSDTCLGTTGSCAPSTSLISVAPDGVTPANGASSQPSISPDGQYVAFVSTATNLAGTTTTGTPEIYLRSTCLNAAAGCSPATRLASVAADGITPADGASSAPAVSSGGRFVAFSSTATNLVSIPSAGTQQLYWRDTCIGAASCNPATSLVSVGSDGSSPGNGPSGPAALTSDGRFVAFSSQATNLLAAALAPGTPQQVYERDMCAGASAACTRATALVSLASDGISPANSVAEFPQVDQSGRFILFASAASNLVSTTTNGFEQIFGRDTCAGAAGCTARTALISVAADGKTLGNGNSLYPAITTQAHFATFLSFANNIVGDDTTPTIEDIFLAITTF